MLEIFKYDFMQRALLASLCMGVLCPAIGVFLVLRRTSMMGDALAHASLAGTACSLASGVNPVFGSLVFTGGCGLLAEALRGSFQDRGDLILSIVLAMTVGIASTLITSGAVPGSAENFLFGSVLTVSESDLEVIAGITAAAVAFLARFRNALVTIAFDEDSARVAGLRVWRYRAAFAVLTACAVSAAIPVAGVLVITSMIAMPVAAALEFRVGFRSTFALAIAIGILDAAAGLCLAAFVDAAPGGLTAIVSVFVLFAILAGKRIKNFAAKRIERSA